MSTAMQKRAYNASMLCTAATAYASGRPSSWLLSSPADMAHRVGLWLKANGHKPPQECIPSRGYTWRVDGMVLSFAGDSQRPTRIA